MRFKFNLYHRRKNIILESLMRNFERTAKVFYSLETFDHSVYHLPQDMTEDYPITTIWYRLQNFEAKHERVRTQLTKDLLTPSASIISISVSFQIIFLGKFIKFL